MEEIPEDLAEIAAGLDADVHADLDRFLVDVQFVFKGTANLAVVLMSCARVIVVWSQYGQPIEAE